MLPLVTLFYFSPTFQVNNPHCPFSPSILSSLHYCPTPATYIPYLSIKFDYTIQVVTFMIRTRHSRILYTVSIVYRSLVFYHIDSSRFHLWFPPPALLHAITY